MADGWLRTNGQKGFRQRGNIRQVENPANPSAIHPLHTHTHTHTHTAGEKPLRRGADKTLIIRSSSPPFLFCLALFLFHVLSVPINNPSLPPPLPAPSTIKSLWQAGGGVGPRILLASSQNPSIGPPNALQAAQCLESASRTGNKLLSGEVVARCHWSNDVNNQPLWLHNEACEEDSTNSFASVWMEAFSVVSPQTLIWRVFFLRPTCESLFLRRNPGSHSHEQTTKNKDCSLKVSNITHERWVQPLIRCSGNSHETSSVSKRTRRRVKNNPSWVKTFRSSKQSTYFSHVL